jgi:hypothetical protein
VLLNSKSGANQLELSAAKPQLSALTRRTMKFLAVKSPNTADFSTEIETDSATIASLPRRANAIAAMQEHIWTVRKPFW